jgi:tetratricopeptide (TPR) repeat protein
MSARSDAERLARTRILCAVLLIYLVCMGFMALGDAIYVGTPHLVWSRLATIPFFLLVVRRFTTLVRVRAPALLTEARQLIAIGKPRAARDKLAEAAASIEGSREAARLDRSRRLLQDGLAVPVLVEIRIEQGRCSLLLGELERAVADLERAHSELPARADVAIDLAEALSRTGQNERAAEVLRAALPHMDELDLLTLRDQPSLDRLVLDAPRPARSRFARRILLERALLGLLLVGSLVHAAHLYLRLI